MSASAQTTKAWRLFNGYFILIIFAALFSGFCNQFFNSTMSLHIHSMGMQTANTGILGAAYTISATVFRLVGGRLCDRGRRRSIILGSLLVFMLTSLACGFTRTFGQLFFCRLLQGAGFAVSGTGISVAVADVVPKEKLGEGIGYYGLGNSLTQALGPTIALALFGFGQFKAVAIGAAVALGISMLIMLFCRYESDAKFPGNRLNAAAEEKKQPEQAAPQGEYRGVWKIIERGALPAACVQFFVTFSTGAVMLYLTLYASKTGIANAGLFFTLSAVTTVLARLVTGRLSDRYGPMCSLVPGVVMGVLAFLLLIFSEQQHMLYYIAGAVYGLYGGLSGPALNAAAIKNSPAERKGAASATYQLPIEIAYTIAGIVLGVLIDAVGFQAVFVISAACALVAMLLGFVLLRSKKA